jgi:uncharacterized surface protein with fasciclin (FAS1) repeats
VTLVKTTFAMLTMATLTLCCPLNSNAISPSYSFQEGGTMLQYIIDNQPVLANLIAKSGLTPIFSGNGTYTLLAPSEEKLKALENESAQRIRAVLSGHIIKGRYLESDLKDGANVETLAGTKIIICRKKDHTLVDGVRIKNANREVKNGLIHTIDGIIKV